MSCAAAAQKISCWYEASGWATQALGPEHAPPGADDYQAFVGELALYPRDSLFARAVLGRELVEGW